MRNKRIRWEYGLCTHKGLYKSVNEDRLFLKLGHSEYRRCPVIALIADGMGGYGHGELASEMCLEMVKNWLDETLTLFDQSSDNFFSMVSQEIVDLFGQINERLYAYMAETDFKLGTTLSLLFIFDEIFVVVHVGDSRIYQFSSDSAKVINVIKQLTVDDSWVIQQVKLGIMSEEEARIHPKRNVLTQCLGLTPEVDVFTFSNSFDVENLFLMCSDGFYALFSEGEILSLVIEQLDNNSDLQQMAECLVALALDRGAQDNVSVLLIRPHFFKREPYWRKWWVPFNK